MFLKHSRGFSILLNIVGVLKHSRGSGLICAIFFTCGNFPTNVNDMLKFLHNSNKSLFACMRSLL